MNVLLIHSDQQRYDSLGCNGNPGAVTPNLDALAAEGTRCTRHFSANPVCMPSRSSFFTGTYPSKHGVVTNGIPLPQRDSVPEGPLVAKYRKEQGNEVISHLTTMGEHLKSHGYSSSAIGKLHLSPTQCHPSFGNKENRTKWLNNEFSGDQGPYCGFDSYLATIGHGEQVHGAYGQWLKENCPDFYNEVFEAERANTKPQPAGPAGTRPSNVPERYHHSAWLGDRTCRFIEEQSSDQPFFLFVGFPDPHHPWTPPQETLDEYRSIIEAKGIQRSQFHRHSSLHGKLHLANPILSQEQRNRRIPGSNEEEQREAVNCLQEFTNTQNFLIDKQVGKIIGALKEKGIYEETLIVFTSDHGDYLGDYGQLAKDMYTARALCNVSLILKGPGVPRGKVDTTASSNTDIFPSICHLLDIPVPPGVQGESILKARTRLPMSQSIMDSAGRNISIWDDEYRLTIFPGSRQIELFHHPTDPYELEDCSASEDHREAKERLYQRLLEQTIEVLSPTIGRISNW